MRSRRWSIGGAAIAIALVAAAVASGLLGEALSTRIELEDRLIRAMLGEDELAA